MGRSVPAVVVVLSLLAVPAAEAAPQDDAGSGADAGDTFEDATPIAPRGAYAGRLDRDGGDVHDYYRFRLAEGAAVSVLVEVESSNAEPIEILDPDGVPVDVGTRVAGVGVTHSAAFTSQTTIRLAVHRARQAGGYRLHLQGVEAPLGAYRFCFMSCEGALEDARIDLLFGGSLPQPETRVLLIPPSHGDLGDPDGPTVFDYLDATLRGIRRWTEAMDAFADDYPRFAYLREISFHVEIFDGVSPIDPAGYDVVLGYVAAGPAFRGVAAQTPLELFTQDARFSGRAIALSLFGSSPRAGQVLWDFPEIIDLEVVTTHEFGHTFGLGHTRMWHRRLGPDVMNSPAPFVYGNGFPFGDGGERTARACLSSLDLFGMAHLYRWLPSGDPEPSFGMVSLPADIPYTWYC